MPITHFLEIVEPADRDDAGDGPTEMRIGELALDGGPDRRRDEIYTEQTARLLGNDHDGRHVGRLRRVSE